MAPAATPRPAVAATPAASSMPSSSKPSKAKSCRECVRLKLKCSRSPWPCDKCVQRGTASLCPGDELPTRPYKKARKSRSKPAPEAAEADDDADADADATFHQPPPTTARTPRRSFNAPDPAPTAAMTQATSPAAVRSPREQPSTDQRMRAASDTTRASASSPKETDQGTLALGRSGMSSYIGPGGHSFSLAQPAQQGDLYSRAGSPYNSEEDQHQGLHDVSHAATALLAHHHSPASLHAAAEAPPVLTTILQRPAAFFPAPGVRSPFSDRMIVDELSKHLPAVTQARRAFRVYKYNVAWMYDPVTRLDELWEDFYSEGEASDRRRPSTTGRRHPHRLALLFSVLSLGVLFDVRPGARDSRAELYYHVAWSALQASNFGDSNTLESVQAVHLMGQYLCNRKNGRNADAFYPLIGTAVRTAVAMGLHRDAQAWNLPPVELEERRRLFWELYACDAFRSLAYGRPCSLQDHHADAVFPMNRCERPDAEDFHIHKFRVVRILNQILDTCHCRPNVSYSTVLDFDKELRELWSSLPPELSPESWAIPPRADLDRASDELVDAASLAEMQVQIQAHTVVANVNQTLLHLHRPWFIRAMQLETDPFHSPYVRSIVAVSESSRILISIASSMLAKVPRLSLAWNFWWQHVFNAGVCQCLHVLYNPHGITTFSAWEDVGKAVSLLERARPGKDDVIWAGKLDLLARMKAKAASRLKGGGSPRPGASGEEVNEQLHLVGATSSIDRRSRDAKRGASRRASMYRGRGSESATSDEPAAAAPAPSAEQDLSAPLPLSSLLEDPLMSAFNGASAMDWGLNSGETLLTDMLQDGCEPDRRFWEHFLTQIQQQAPPA